MWDDYEWKWRRPGHTRRKHHVSTGGLLRVLQTEGFITLLLNNNYWLQVDIVVRYRDRIYRIPATIDEVAKVIWLEGAWKSEKLQRIYGEDQNFKSPKHS